MARGQLLWFDQARGFGFIRPEMGPRDVFVHASALADAPRDPAPGAKVEFELLQSGDGRLTAQRVVWLDRPAGRGANGGTGGDRPQARGAKRRPPETEAKRRPH